MRRYSWTLVAGLIILAVAAIGQTKIKSMSKPNKDWIAVDSLINIGKPESAKKIVTILLQKAQDDNAKDEIIKAKAWLLALDQQEEDASAKTIYKLEAAIANTNDPIEKAIWQNLTAKTYWQFLQNNRYQIYDRSVLANETAKDINTWDVRRFHQKISELFVAALNNKQILRVAKIEDYKNIIATDSNTRATRTSIYDLIAFDALDYFQSDERDLINPTYKFQLDQKNFFAPANNFATLKIESKDSLSLKWHALKIYQDLLSNNLQKNNTAALIDADLTRLSFVYNNSTLNNKKECYKNALIQLANQYASQNAAAQVYFQAINIDLNTEVDYEDRLEMNTNVQDFRKIVVNLETLIKKYPGSEGAINAQNTLNKILQQSLQLHLEEAYLPNENIKILLDYKNTTAVSFNLYTSNLVNARNENYKGKLVKTWEQKLINAQDHQKHSVELKVNALPIGIYLLEVNDPSGKVSTRELLQVSNLSAISAEGNQNSDNKLWVLHRKDGKYIPNAKMLHIEYNYENKSGKYVGALKNTTNGETDGSIPLMENRSNYSTAFAINKGEDTFLIDQNRSYGLRYREQYNAQEIQQNHDFIFTDRSIYRPGQTIYFKAIMLQSKNKKDYKIISNKTVTVIFRDANYQIIKELKLKSNEYGSVSGSFTAPSTGLTGNMSISSENGSAQFNVEEYKRPKFYVVVDTLKDNIKLNEIITITGKALAYAGNNVDHAEVKYRVIRKTRYPYSWLYRGYLPSTEEMEIANGTATTNELGAYSIKFKAIPDASIDPKTLPVFNYEINVDVTDINGETRSEAANVSLGYTSLDIAIQAPSQTISQTLKEINVYTRNLNGTFTKANVTIEIRPLEKSKKLYRERLWSMPTDFLYDEATFHSYFPEDVYKEENNLTARKRLAPIWKQQLESQANGKITIPSDLFKESGYYEIIATAKDKDGKDVVQKHLVFVLNPDNTANKEIPLLSITDRNTYEPGENIKNFVVPGFDNSSIIQSNSWKKQFALNKNGFTIPVSEADRGSKRMNWMYVHNNRIYVSAQSIVIPWTNKDLQIEWATHRDKVQPGAKEEWTFTIRGLKKEKVAAELVAGLYDASLEALKPHNWHWNKLYGQDYEYFNWNNYGFNSKSSEIDFSDYNSENYLKTYPIWSLPELGTGRTIYGRKLDRRNFTASLETVSSEEIAMKSAVAASLDGAAPGLLVTNNEHSASISDSDIVKNETNPAMITRTNLQETAFFFPELQTDANGDIKVRFTLPEALTEWKLMTFAHTKDWKTGFLNGSIKTQKELMVTPNLPRFFRQGDEVTIASKISNLSDKRQTGMVKVDFFDATTMKSVNEAFGYKNVQQQFSADALQSTVSNFTVTIPDDIYNPILVRIVANNENFSDGEEHIIPVVSNRMLVTETMPMAIRGNENATFTFEKLLQSQKSSSLKHHTLTVEYTSNPAWYAAQALPYLIEFPYECAEQTFNRFYANALAAHIVAQSPKVASVFKRWNAIDTNALISNLEKNQELKTALLEETPWVLQAQSETEQKKNIARLFETHKMAQGLDNAIAKLAKLQNSDGSFGWFSGMNGNSYITQYILTGIAKLQHLNVSSAQTKNVTDILNKGLKYADTELLKTYRTIKKENLDKNNLSQSAIQYLYIRSFLKKEIDKEVQIATTYYRNQSTKYWMQQSNMIQGMIAMIANRSGDKFTSKTIMESLQERSIRNKEMGMYWNDSRSYMWYQLPIETHALLITAFNEIQGNDVVVDQLKLWLLKQKQTQHWPTTTATADAVYALLQTGSDWLQNEPAVAIELGDWKINSGTTSKEAGTGYFSQQLSGNKIKAEMANVNVNVSNMASNTATSWGAVYWQYFENMDKVTHSGKESPLQLSKQLFKEKYTDRGPVLEAISEKTPLQVGDKVKVRIILKADRAMDYVHLKDMRAAGFEPTQVLSGYKWNQGLGYYEATKDLASHFFFDHLPKGTFVFEYSVFVSQKGNFSNGISTVQCMYAPEFNAHTEGIRVSVK